MIALDFVREVDALRPSFISCGRILLGVQHENSTFTPHGFTGEIREGTTHINSGLFHKPDRSARWSEQGHLCHYTMALVLDDVGNPDKVSVAPDLRPTWKLETSPGSVQWV